MKNMNLFQKTLIASTVVLALMPLKAQANALQASFEALTISGAKYAPAPYPLMRIPLQKVKSCQVSFEQKASKELELSVKVEAAFGAQQVFRFSNVPNFVKVQSGRLIPNAEIIKQAKSSQKIVRNPGAANEMLLYSLANSTLPYYIFSENRNVYEKAEMFNIYEYQETQAQAEQRLLNPERQYRVAQVYFDPSMKTLKMLRIAQDSWDFYCYFFRF